MAAKVPKTKKSTFQNMVQKVRKFAGGTPDRYHTRSKKYDKFVPSGKPAAQPSLTKPEAPELMTEGRTRPARPVTPEEKFVFKAAPVNESVMMSAGDYGVPVVKPRKATVPASPMVGKRGPEPKQRAVQQEEAFVFKAAPVNPRIMMSAGDYGVPVVHPTKTTETKPFKQMEQHKDPMQTRAALATAAAERETAREAFKAQPLPDNSAPASLPTVEAKPPTQQQPFNLRSASLRSQSRAALEQRVKQEDENRLAAAEFKATEVKAVERPFKPAKSTRPLTDIQAFTMSTDQRSMEREIYKRKQAVQQTENEKVQAVLEAKERAAEEKAIQVLRNNSVHKANPVPNYTMMKIKPSQRLLTVPSSPMVGKRGASGPAGIRA